MQKCCRRKKKSKSDSHCSLPLDMLSTIKKKKIKEQLLLFSFSIEFFHSSYFSKFSLSTSCFFVIRSTSSSTSFIVERFVALMFAAITKDLVVSQIVVVEEFLANFDSDFVFEFVLSSNFFFFVTTIIEFRFSSSSKSLFCHKRVRAASSVEARKRVKRCVCNLRPKSNL
jgi:hypothetical protein